MHAQFAVHMLTDEGKSKAQEIAEGFDTLLTKLEQIVPEGRHLALVRTKLEEACFFAKKGMAEKHCQGPEGHVWDDFAKRWVMPGAIGGPAISPNPIGA